MNVSSPGRRPRRAAAAVAAGLALTLTACSGSTDDGSTLDPRAAWTALPLPETARSAGERVALTTVLGAAAGQPRLLAGVGAEPGGTDHARVWTEQAEGGWRWKDLLPGDAHSSVTFAAVDGGTTWVGGTTWAAGEPVAPFVRVSQDRATWAEVDLPDEAAERAVVPGAAVVADGGLLLVGLDGDQRPVAVLAGEDTGFTELPAPPDGRDLDRLTGLARRGDTVVAVGDASLAGAAAETVVYRSTDGGDSWTVAVGPATGASQAAGVVLFGETFVVTGAVRGADGGTTAAAWSSPDGAAWAAEQLPVLDWDRDGLAIREGESSWLSAPSADATRLVAPLGAGSNLRFVVLGRDAAGAWSVTGDSDDWSVAGVGGLAALDDDGSVLLAQSARNTGRVGELLSTGGWRADPLTLGADDSGLRLSGFLGQDAGLEVAGWHETVTTRPDGGWMQSVVLSRYALAADGAVESSWEPAGSREIQTLDSAETPEGAAVLLGAQVSTGDDGRGKVNVAGWHRPAPDAPWAPISGLATDRSEIPADVVAVPGGWVAVGTSRATFDARERNDAAVWTSADGLNWAPVALPGAAASGDSAASGACALPGGDVLVVGSATDDGQDRSRLWRRSGDQWVQVDAGVLGEAAGSLSSCATDGDTTLVQGTSGGRPTVWRSGDGQTFTAQALGGRADSFGQIRAFDGGFAAAGTQGSDGHRDAVAWLSADGRSWRAVVVPADRPLTGVDVRVRDGQLLLAANSTSAPEVWALADPAALVTEG